MSVQLTTPPRPDHSARSPHRGTHTVLAVAGISAAIAAGGFAAGQILLSDHSAPTRNSQYVPSPQALRELGATVAAEYRTGLTTAPSPTGVSDAGAGRALRQSIANQYRSR